MEINLFKRIGKGEYPSRLFIGGLHGKEGLSTIHAIKSVEDIDIKEGKLVICNLTPSPYLSTLDPLYYLSLAGMKVIELIKKYQPKIYLELHCYHPDKKNKLINKDRKDLFGVPGLVELEEGVMIGSTSPLIRSVFFDLNDFPFILEMPCDPSAESLKVSNNIMKIVARANDRREIMEEIRRIYPEQIQLLNEYFTDFSQNFWPAFQETKKNVANIELKTFQDLDGLITGIIREERFNLNSAQLKQLGQALMVWREYNLQNHVD